MTDPDRADSSDMESVEDEECKVTTLNPDILAALRNRFCSVPDIDVSFSFSTLIKKLNCEN